MKIGTVVVELLEPRKECLMSIADHIIDQIIDGKRQPKLPKKKTETARKKRNLKRAALRLKNLNK